MSADDVSFSGDEFTNLKVCDACAYFCDVAGEFMADGHANGDGFLCPFVPFVDVEICSADGGFFDFDEDVHGANFGHGDVF